MGFDIGNNGILTPARFLWEREGENGGSARMRPYAGGLNPQRVCSPFLQAGRASNTNVPYGFS
jgi:hypothetical protein